MCEVAITNQCSTHECMYTLNVGLETEQTEKQPEERTEEEEAEQKKDKGTDKGGQAGRRR